MIGKNYCIVYLYTYKSKIDCFRRVHKILQWIMSSDFNIAQANERNIIIIHVLNQMVSYFRNDCKSWLNIHFIMMKPLITRYGLCTLYKYTVI